MSYFVSQLLFYENLGLSELISLLYFFMILWIAQIDSGLLKYIFETWQEKFADFFKKFLNP